MRILARARYSGVVSSSFQGSRSVVIAATKSVLERAHSVLSTQPTTDKLDENLNMICAYRDFLEGRNLTFHIFLLIESCKQFDDIELSWYMPEVSIVLVNTISWVLRKKEGR